MIAEDINILKVAKVKCLKSLLFHTRYFFKHQYNRKFIVAEHHEIIANALQRVIRGELKRLIINVFPRSGKTELAVKSFISNGLAINPSAKFIHISYSDSLALDNSEAVKDLVQSDAYQELFPNVQIKKDSKAKDKWYTTSGGGVLARAAGSSLTGFGAGQVDDPDKDLDEFVIGNEGFGGAIIIDDPLKPLDADSDIQRERVNERFDNTIRNRVNSRHTPIIVIMQRLHPRDLTGYLTRDGEADNWEIISLPALRDDGTALWPLKHTVEELIKLKTANDVVFERQYQQNPKPKEGLLFDQDELNYYNPETVDVEKLAEFKFSFIDPAGEGADDLAAPVAYLVGNKIYVPDVIYNKHGTDINEPACVELIIKHRLNAANIEGNSAWRLFATAVRTKVQERYEDCEIRVTKAHTNKHTRILAASAFIRNNFIFRSDYKQIPEYRKFMEVLTSYMRIQEGLSKNAHDDAPDACQGIAEYFMNNFKHLW